MRPLRVASASAWSLVTFWSVLAALPPAAAHIGGALVETRFSVPSWVLSFAGGLVVAGSFMLVAAFQKPHTAGRMPARPVVWAPDAGLPEIVGGPLVSRGTLGVARLLGMLAWVWAVLPWFLPFLHPTPRPDTLFWVLVWAFMPILVVLFGDLWALVDPMRTIGAWIRTARREPFVVASPRVLGFVGVVSFLSIVAFEILLAGYAADGMPAWMGAFASDLGDVTAGAIVAYTVLNVIAMFLFGVGPWLTHGEAIGRFFRTWSAISMRVVTTDGVLWGWPGWYTQRTLVGGAAPWLVVAMLTAVNFDSLAHSAWGAWLRASLARLGPVDGALILMLLGMFALFAVVWLRAARGVRDKAEDIDPPRMVSSALVPVLLPIAFGYHLAHNLEQSIAALPGLLPASIVGTASYQGIAWGSRAGTFWALFQVVAVLGGHLVAVLMSHRVVGARYGSRIQAFYAEVPLTIVMVVYTLIGLALLGAPATGGGA